MASNDEEFMDCYEVNDDGVTHKSTKLNEGDDWFFGLFPKAGEKNQTDAIIGILVLIFLPIIVILFITLVIKYIPAGDVKKSVSGGGLRRR
jgi:sorbitol-specific phosphotransferase system component IIC